ncbi:MFS transporter [Sphingomonas sp. RT2P30]|uniref:MFS transporter n=1 Tax=Parasphingomonas halimpatiens TaxID=3096162 RepID=UPI002FC74756
MKATPLAEHRANPLDEAPIRARQILVLITAVLLAGLDGFDAMSMSFVAPSLAREWHLGKDVIGLLLASSLAGMAVGAILLSPLADRLGRKKVVLGAILLLTAGAGFSAAATSVPLLIATRLLTGIGIGVMVAMTTLISAEFTNVRRRSVAVAAVATLGFPLGGVLGGLGAAAILKSATWHWVFLSASLSGVALFALVAIALPESPAFIVARRGPDALARVNRVLAGLGQPAMTELPAATDQTATGYRSLFATGIINIVLRLMATTILIATASYYILNWLPQLVVDAGFTPSQGSLVSALAGVLGLLGGVGFAIFASRFAPTKVAATAMAGATVSLAAVGLAPPTIALFVVSAGALSFCLAGTTGMLYSIMADTFPPALRASGIGLVMGAARICSAAGPALAGVMFKHGMTRAEVSLFFAIGPLVAAVLIGTFRHQSHDSGRP